MTKKATATTPSYFTAPCERCGKPKLIGKTWKETIETYSGKSEIEHTQIVCSDKACQEAFEKALAEETKKKEALKAGREADALARKALNTAAKSTAKLKN